MHNLTQLHLRQRNIKYIRLLNAGIKSGSPRSLQMRRTMFNVVRFDPLEVAFSARYVGRCDQIAAVDFEILALHLFTILLLCTCVTISYCRVLTGFQLPVIPVSIFFICLRAIKKLKLCFVKNES